MTDYKITMDDDGKVTASQLVLPLSYTAPEGRTTNHSAKDYWQRCMPDWNAMALEACDRLDYSTDDLEFAVWHGGHQSHERMTARLEICFKDGHRCMLTHQVVLS